jgi:hypothetical protein
MSNLDQIKAKLRKLRAVTQAGGYSEAECLAAARAAAKIAADHGLDAGGWIVAKKRVGLSRSKDWSCLFVTISDATGTSCFRECGDVSRIVYFGQEPDVLVADFIHDVAIRALEGVGKTFRASVEYKRRRTDRTRKAALHAFMIGAVMGLSKNLDSLTTHAVRQRQASAADALSARASLSQDKPQKRRRHDERLLARGFAAGSDIQINSGITSATDPVALIGGR